MALRGAVLGGLVAQECCKKQYKMHVFNVACFRYLGSLGTLLGAILACLVTKNGIPNPVKSGPKSDPKIDQFLLSLGAVLGSILGPDCTENPIKRWTKILT